MTNARCERLVLRNPEIVLEGVTKAQFQHWVDAQDSLIGFGWRLATPAAYRAMFAQLGLRLTIFSAAVNQTGDVDLRHKAIRDSAYREASTMAVLSCRAGEFDPNSNSTAETRPAPIPATRDSVETRKRTWRPAPRRHKPDCAAARCRKMDFSTPANVPRC
jgi:hypothetical protein